MNVASLRRWLPGSRWLVIAPPYLWMLLFFAIPFAIAFGIMAVVLARRARELERATLGKAGGARAAQIGRLLGILGLCLAASATIAVAVYELLVAVE